MIGHTAASCCQVRTDIPARGRAAVVAICLLTSLGSCRARDLDFADPLASDELVAPRADPGYAGQGQIHARQVRLVTRLAVPEAGPFAAMTVEARARLDALRQQSTHMVDAFELSDRLLIVLSAHHPGGPLDLVLCADLDRLFVFDHARRRAAVLPREALPDVLDAARGFSTRDDFTPIEDAFEARPGSTGDLPRASKVSRRPTTGQRESRRRLVAHRAGFALSYRPPGQQSQWTVSLLLDSAGPDEPERFPAQHPLYHLALPLLQDYRGLLVLESLTFESARPARWTLAVTNETLATTTTRWRTVVQDRGWVSLPLARFAVVRDGYRTSSSLWRIDGSRQLRTDQELGGLRQRPVAGPLEVTNRSAHAALIHVDGVLVGWVAPGAALAINGLAAGFYRLFACSPTGARAWGPNDTYVPGPLVLR